MKVESALLGAVDVPDDRIFSFPEGLPALGGKLYALIADKEVPIVEWLQSIDDREITLLLIDPALVLPGFTANPKPAEIRPIKPEDNDEVISYRVIARGGEHGAELVLNLFAPVFFNPARRLAMQVPLVGSGLGVREVWPPKPKTAEATQSEESAP
jgi:flagellar assembly factor FliW